MEGRFLTKYDLGQKLRWYSGVILMIYACTHLLNHSLGIVSLDFMERGRLVFVGFWRHPVLSWVVPTSLIVHAVMVFYKLYWKSTFKGLRRSEWIQIVLGLMLPVMLFSHLFETRLSRLYFGIDDTYSFYIGSYYPGYLIDWPIIVTIIWVHGVIGLNMYLKQKSWYHRWKDALTGLYTSIPLLAVIGVVSAGKEIQRYKQDPAWFQQVQEQANPSGYDWEGTVLYYTIAFLLVYILFLMLFFGARYLRLRKSEQNKNILIKYLNGEKVAISKGTTLLEASLKAQISHAHACGGRGRCSTCRVQVVEGLENISPPGEDELLLLKKVKVNKNVRLACKSIPYGACTVHPLLAAKTTGSPISRTHPEKQGVDKEIAILFSDLREFTAMTEHKLPYDVVHVLNQYYQFMGQAIESNGGKVDKFIGDGIMALFGLESGIEKGCAEAMVAAKAMSKQLVLLNESLKNELDSPLELGMGIHCGPVVVGEMGYRNVTSITAIGDVANTSSRLESECKRLGCELVVSDRVARNAGADLSGFPSHLLQVRGRSQPLMVYSLKKVSDWQEELMLLQVAEGE